MSAVPVQFIYFDLGNVLLKFDHERARNRLAELSGQPSSHFDDSVFTSGLQNRYETGEIDDAEFARSVADGAGCNLSQDDVLHACSDIFEVNAPVVSVIAALKNAGHRLGILSNTCHAHWSFIQSKQYPLIRDFFDFPILSYVSKSMKPDPGIYRDAIAAAEVPAESIFFTDDRQENVSGAQDAGMDATIFVDVTKLIRDLHARGVAMQL